MASKYTAAVRELLESDLECPHCHAFNTPGRGGKHIHIEQGDLAVCGVCGNDFPLENLHGDVVVPSKGQ